MRFRRVRPEFSRVYKYHVKRYPFCKLQSNGYSVPGVQQFPAVVPVRKLYPETVSILQTETQKDRFYKLQPAGS